MAYSYVDLKKKTVAELREIASKIEHPEVQGYSQMNKEQLLKSLCNVFTIDRHKHHSVVGLDKKEIKTKLKELKANRDNSISEKNHKELKIIRRKIHRLKRKIHKAMV